MTPQHSDKPCIEFIGCSDNQIKILYSALKQISSKLAPRDIWQNIQSGSVSESLMQQEIKQFCNIQQSQPSSSRFIFVVKNISYSCITYMEKKGFGLESTVLTNETILPIDVNLSYTTPDVVLKNDALNKRWQKIHAEMVTLYRDCLADDIDEKSAKQVLTSASTSRRQLSFSFCELAEFLSSAMCFKSDEEIKHISWQMYRFMKAEFPTLAKKLGIKCWENKDLFCNESLLTYQNCPFSAERPHQGSLSKVFYQAAKPQPSVNIDFSQG